MNYNVLYPYSALRPFRDMRLEYALSTLLDCLSQVICEHVLHMYLSGLYSIAGLKWVTFTLCVQSTGLYYALGTEMLQTSH